MTDRRVDKDGIEWVYSPGGKKWVAVGSAPESKPKKARRKAFKAGWVKLPLTWVEALRKSKIPVAYQLAHAILFEAFKREQVGGEIILSAEVTKMPRNSRRRAAKELVKLGLIRLHRKKGKAYRVSLIIY
jgi:hypothetical protein